MLVEVKVVIHKIFKRPLNIEILEEDGKRIIKVLALLDTGADSCMINSELQEYFKFQRTKIEDVQINTVHGTKNTLLERTKVSLLTNNSSIVNIEASTNSKNLGNEKQMDKQWVSTALQSLGVREECTKFFQVRRCGTVKLIIGLKTLSKLANRVPLELLDLTQPPSSPEIGVYYTELDHENKFILAGSLGINKSLMDSEFPIFLIPMDYKFENYELKNKEEKINEMNHKEDKVMLSRTECNELKNFLEEEALVSMETKRCELHETAINNCDQCSTIRKTRSLLEEEICKEISRNMVAVKEGDNFRLTQKLVFTKDEQKLFDPLNSNYSDALSGSKTMLSKLKKLGKEKVEEFDSQVKKSIKDDCFEKLSDEEIQNLEYIPHFYTMGNMVWNSNSSSTSVRMINDTARPIKGQMASVSTSNYCPRKVLNNMYTTLIRFLLYEIGYSSDVQGAYRAIKCSYLDSFLRLFIWFEDLDDPDNSIVIYRRKSLDFVDGSASCSFEVGSTEHVSEEAKLEISKKIIRDIRYADNNLFSFQDKLLYFLVKKDIDNAGNTSTDKDVKSRDSTELIKSNWNLVPKTSNDENILTTTEDNNNPEKPGQQINTAKNQETTNNNTEM